MSLCLWVYRAVVRPQHAQRYISILLMFDFCASHFIVLLHRIYCLAPIQGGWGGAE